MAEKTKKLHVQEEPGSERLDVWLARELKISRSQAQKLIQDDRVFVNGNLPKKAGDVVKAGTEILIVPEVDAAQELRKKTSEQKIDKAEKVAVEVVADTPDYIVINKPAGLLVHPTQAQEKNTLVSWLVKKYPKIKTVGDDPSVRPGIVHRLDKEASGLLVVAKTQKMFDLLKEQFKNRTVEKEYMALAHGKMPKEWDILTFPIARSENNDRMAARPYTKEHTNETGDNDLGSDDLSPAKDAKTEFFVQKSFANCTLLRIILYTGRMHQIRVHMLAYNHPLVGDPLYFQKKRKKNLDEKCGRLFLHSVKLSFNDALGAKQTFEVSLPKTLQNFVDSLS